MDIRLQKPTLSPLKIVNITYVIHPQYAESSNTKAKGMM
jgi:hypothetical protein